jgi:hypothetical protein
MPGQLSNVTTADSYEEATTLHWPGTVQVVLQVANAAILLQVDSSEKGNGEWGSELFIAPVIGVLPIVCSGIRVRSAVLATPAQVTAQLFTGDEALGGGQLAPFTGKVSPGGVVSGVSGLPAGVVVPYAGSAAPAGYVLCDGSLYNGSDPAYSTLWSAIGTTYGGTGQTSFAVPDLRGRVAVGRAAGGKAEVNALGNNDGLAANLRNISHRHTFKNLGPSSGVAHGNNRTEVDASTSGDADNPDRPAYLVLNYLISLG